MRVRVPPSPPRMNLPSFTYRYDAGPLTEDDLRLRKIGSGNCRLAIQAYFYFVYNKYLSPDQILLPNGYLRTGNFVTGEGEDNFILYNPGDVIYAERILSKFGKKVNRRRKDFQSEAEWIVSLHSAIYLGEMKVFHATSIEGETCVWEINKFCQFYRIVGVKRVLS